LTSASALSLIGDQAIPFLYVSGSAREQGLQRGQALKSMVGSRR